MPRTQKSRVHEGKHSDRASTALSNPGREVEDYDAEETIVENMKALVDKERALSHLQVLEKERELLQLREQYEILLQTREPQTSEKQQREINTPGFSAEQSTLEMKLSRMPVLTNIERLSLANCNLNEQDIRTIALQLRFLPKVRDLDLSSNELEDSCSASLCLVVTESSNLRSLDLHKNELSLGAVAAIIRAIVSVSGKLQRKANKLKSLDITDNPFVRNQEAGKVLGAEIPYTGLSKLRISIHDSPKPNQKRRNSLDFLQGISKWPSVMELALVYSTLHIRSLKKLCSCTFFEKLEVLDLRFAFIGPEGASILSKTFQNQKLILNKLNLTCNSLGFAGCEAILRGAVKVTSLSWINLSNNRLGGYRSCATLGVIAEVLPSMPWLETLDISRNDFTGAQSSPELRRLQSVMTQHQALSSLGPMVQLQFDAGQLKQFRKSLNSYKTSHHDLRNATISSEGYSVHRILKPVPMTNQLFDSAIPPQYSIRLSRSMMESGIKESDDQEFKVFLRVKLSSCSANTSLAIQHHRRGAPIGATLEVKAQQVEDTTNWHAHVSIEHCRSNDDILVTSSQNEPNVLEFALVFLPSKALMEPERCEEIARGPTEIYAEHWARRITLSKHCSRGSIKYQTTVFQSPSKVPCAMQISWEDRVENNNGNPVGCGTSKLPRGCNWQLLRNNELNPLQHNNEVSSTHPDAVSSTGFVKRVVRLEPGVVLTGDTLTLELRNARPNDDSGAFDNSTATLQNTAVQLHSKNFVVHWVKL